MQKYLKSSNLKMKKEEAQTVFSLRCRITDVKNIYKGSYETYPEYNKLFDGNLESQLEISKHFLENMKIKKKTKSSKKT
jgi:hypothetical protein